MLQFSHCSLRVLGWIALSLLSCAILPCRAQNLQLTDPLVSPGLGYDPPGASFHFEVMVKVPERPIEVTLQVTPMGSGQAQSFKIAGGKLTDDQWMGRRPVAWDQSFPQGQYTAVMKVVTTTATKTSDPVGFEVRNLWIRLALLVGAIVGLALFCHFVVYPIALKGFRTLARNAGIFSWVIFLVGAAFLGMYFFWFLEPIPLVILAVILLISAVWLLRPIE